MRAIALSLIMILHALVATAAIEFLPEMKTEEDLDNMREKIQRRLPWIEEDNSNEILNRQKLSVESLRKAFPDYNKWAKSKPDPIVIQVDRVEAAGAQAAILSKEQMAILQKQASEMVTKWFGSENISAENKEKMQLLVFEKLSEFLLSGADSVRGAVTGLIQVLPGNQRGEIFKLGQAQLQIEALEKIITTDSQLKQSQFRPEALGLTAEELTVKNVFARLKSRMNQSQNVFVAMSVLQAFEKFSASKKAAMKANTIGSVLSSADFGFVGGPKDPVFAKILEGLGKVNANKLPQLTKSLEASMSSIPRSWFEVTEQAAKSSRNYLRIVEVHPYLGVYRGCVGGDCSTDYSSMFAYIPWEHIFYIQRPGGTFVGYVSATRVLVNGKPAFYLKDLTGATLSAAMAEVVVNAFSRVFKYYGAETFVIAAPQFTDGQNHFEKLQDMLRKYNRRVPAVPLKFEDAAMRAHIHRNDHIFSSSGDYDSPDMHSTGVPFVPSESVLKDYDITFEKGTLNPFVPTTPKDALIHALNMLNVDANARITKDKTDMMEVREVYNLLKNAKGLKLDTYYRNLKTSFAKFGVDLSRSFRTENEALFVRGHISASDAFSHSDESMRNESEKHLMNFIRQHRDFIFAMEIVQRWQEPLNRSRRMKEVVELFAQRLNSVDAMNLLAMAEAGIQSAKNAVATERVQAQASGALTYFVDQVTRDYFIAQVSQKNPFAVLSWTIKNASRLTTKEFEVRVAESLNRLGVKKISKEVKDIFFRNRLNCKDSLNEEYFSVNFPFFVEKVKSGQMNRSELTTILFKKAKSVQASGMLRNHVDSLVKSATPLDLYEIYALATFGIEDAKAAVQIPAVKARVLSLLADWSTTALEANPQLKEIVEKNAAEFPRNEALNFAATFRKVSSNGNASTAEDLYKNIDAAFAALGWSHQDLLQQASFRKRIGGQHLERSGAFRSSDPKMLSYSMQFLWDGILSGDWEIEDMKRLAEAFEKGSLSRELIAPLANRVEAGVMTSSCGGCLYAYAHLILQRHLQEPKQPSLELVHRLLGSGYSLARVYGARLAVIHYPQEVLPRIDFIETARKLTTTPDQVTKNARPALRDLILDVLMRMNTAGNAALPPKIYERVKKVEGDENKIKLAFGILRNGGNLETLRKEAPEIFSEKFAKSASEGGIDSNLFERFASLTSERGYRAERRRQAGMRTNLCRGLFDSALR